MISRNMQKNKAGGGGGEGKGLTKIACTTRSVLKVYSFTLDTIFSPWFKIFDLLYQIQGKCIQY